MESMRRPVVAICGSSAPDAVRDAVAHKLGKGIVARGWTLICGGRTGVMEHACRGGQEAKQDGGDGTVVGVLPDDDTSKGNRYLDVALATGMGYARNVVIVLSADVVVLVGGSTGTLSEAAYAWQYGKPMVAVIESGGWAERLAGTTMDDRRADAVMSAETAEEAVEMVASILAAR